ncbi:uncharacterized protein K452DRAFT_287493 [Aplosporella prunicola CBS 121167]|uniref:Uncharacterized protein n=1 Tax=Aplosporella prunicola CBS 121167 TaxID=1176127 RepID=A0A6A6BHD3_9PEZI|nr:uncharacterized protein K452DRAFT_287493 [Aplosporella prunicola CBS 121167]KAF2142277.1 hypothetical protein K452DRAFT_287493 [Aplosporella prunicola CBS 121167]
MCCSRLGGLPEAEIEWGLCGLGRENRKFFPLFEPVVGFYPVDSATTKACGLVQVNL